MIKICICSLILKYPFCRLPEIYKDDTFPKSGTTENSIELLCKFVISDIKMQCKNKIMNPFVEKPERLYRIWIYSSEKKNATQCHIMFNIVSCPYFGCRRM